MTRRRGEDTSVLLLATFNRVHNAPTFAGVLSWTGQAGYVASLGWEARHIFVDAVFLKDKVMVSYELDESVPKSICDVTK